MPGVRINWAEKKVELDAVVVLREGMLELVACSPQTREHESILRVAARPAHVYQALGLLGLIPGRPPSWDAQAEQVQPATGPRLALFIRYNDRGVRRTDEVHRWLWDSRSDRQAPPLPWVFSGSFTDNGGRLAADLEGTVVCVVDFESALISVPRSYSSRNDELWLRAHTERIPVLGTPCELVIAALPAQHRQVHLGQYGRLWYEGEPLGLLQLQARVRRELESQPGLEVEVRYHARAWAPDLEVVREVLLLAGLPTDRLTWRPAEGTDDQGQAMAPAELIRGQMDLVRELARLLSRDLGSAHGWGVGLWNSIAPRLRAIWAAVGSGAADGGGTAAAGSPRRGGPGMLP